jgi:hypothetical protein
MTMNRPLALTVAAIGGTVLLMACSGEDAAANAPAPAAGAAATALAGGDPLPGLWRSTQSTDGEAPETTEECVTPAEANLERFLADLRQEDTCTLVKSDVSGGRLDLESRCGAAGGMTLKGRYSADSYSYDLVVTAAGVTVPMHVEGRRIGDRCPAE